MMGSTTVPTATAILKRPLFWSPGRQVRFLTLMIYVYIKMYGCTKLADEDYYDDGGASFSNPRCLDLLDADKQVKKHALLF
uniref:Uncharacterized protein n=1 Tax=Panagrellus redivivus TaxID=6233 RepID=A0A7E4VAV9_PANRE